ncbi:hypothetical protein Salat_3000400 [Sesamum alatum]|uniref:Uncharacterized protein n=1 Tax=Sesamum alatum TaxID=300844 RepID=A0AAE1XI77_9LAMI|nr:hypothetical protein Salat_3000400 [Sesamum alatum]
MGRWWSVMACMGVLIPAGQRHIPCKPLQLSAQVCPHAWPQFGFLVPEYYREGILLSRTFPVSPCACASRGRAPGWTSKHRLSHVRARSNVGRVVGGGAHCGMVASISLNAEYTVGIEAPGPIYPGTSVLSFVRTTPVTRFGLVHAATSTRALARCSRYSDNRRIARPSCGDASFKFLPYQLSIGRIVAYYGGDGTPPAPYEKSKSLGSGGSMVARLKLKGIDGRAPPGVEPAA